MLWLFYINTIFCNPDWGWSIIKMFKSKLLPLLYKSVNDFWTLILLSANGFVFQSSQKTEFRRQHPELLYLFPSNLLILPLSLVYPWKHASQLHYPDHSCARLQHLFLKWFQLLISDFVLATIQCNFHAANMDNFLKL